MDSNSRASKSTSRYAVFGQLASGGMASIFYARLVGPAGFSRIVALKRPHAHLATDSEFAKLFIDEARVASRIRHSNVVATLDVIEATDELALVMEYIHGDSLSRLCASARARGERVPLRIATAIAIDILHGLHAAHEATDERGFPLEVVHRDISPQNVLIGADGIARIVDFGVAKAAGALHTTRDGEVVGKYPYMAPEQITGGKVTRRTDIYSASIVIWELLTGTGLFRGESEGEIIRKAIHAVVVAPSAISPWVPSDIDQLVLRGLDRNPARRYATALAMSADLERLSPAVRRSEIAAWVERLAGDTLASRAIVIAQIEQIEQIEAESVASFEPPTETYEISHFDVDVSLSDEELPVDDELDTSIAPNRDSHSRWWIAPTLGLALVATVASSAWLLTNRSVPQSRQKSIAVLPAPTPSPLVAPAPLPVALRPPWILPTCDGGQSCAATATVSVSTPKPPRVAASTTRPARPGNPGPRKNEEHPCIPNYTVNSAGVEIFKPECVK
jgi:eukaryotic-like serine/threonine-protein kinase